MTDEQLAAFRDLPAKEQKNRAAQAEKLLEKIDQLSGAPDQLLLLREAVALDPAQPRHWLQLAELCRRMGYRHAATDALASARSLFNETQGQHRKDCIRDYSLILGWLEYEAGRWAEAEAWGNKALKAGAGLQGSLLELLGMAARPIRYYEFDLKVAVFRPMDNDSHNRRSNAAWAWRQYQHLHKMSFDQGLWENCESRETRLDEHNVLRWRDSGTVCEYNDRGDWADCYYRKSFEAIEGKAGGWLVEHQGGIPGFLPELDPQPFWTNQDGYFVTGSLAAYAEYAYAMMNDSAQAARRAFWAEQFEFAKRPVDPRLDPLEGHIYLLHKKFNRAKSMLEKGVVNFPRNAQCWSDLGIIRAAEGDLPGARHAFDLALSLDRGLAVAWHNRGFLNLKEGDWETALVDLQTAADLAPHDEQLIHDLQRVREKVERDRAGQ